MASSLLLLVSVSWFSSFLALLVSPAQADTCTSQVFNNSNLYSSCTDLPVLSSYLHWTYDTSNSSLSIAFISTPPQSDGWVAWGINPTSTKMAGAQILLAYNTDSGIPTVKTFNISAYTSLVPGKLSFDIWDISSEFSDGTFKIFASVKVPKNKKSVNQVWQVGPAVNQTSGFPDKHDIVGPNLESFQTLSLAARPITGTTINPTTPSTSSSGGGGGGGGSGGGRGIAGGALRIGSGGNVVLFSVLAALIAF
ncbi:auxin-induced in root cultures protein 12-like [Prunus dulcis]|uniref:auxin-induced in root cultures protein 12-like n=1 Tax=Prunus dulcis TaxID=3755 RepID=UPI0014822FF7|nr:auxin-induced in root cultures protein 12-like [Prunus dulcis]